MEQSFSYSFRKQLGRKEQRAVAEAILFDKPFGECVSWDCDGSSWVAHTRRDYVYDILLSGGYNYRHCKNGRQTMLNFFSGFSHLIPLVEKARNAQSLQPCIGVS